MRFTVLGYGAVGLVHGFLDFHRLVRFHITETGMLEKMAPEGIARIPCSFVARRNPRAPFYEVVTGIERRRGEIVIIRMHFKALKPGYGRFGPLPDVADNVIEFSEPEGVARGFVPVWLIGDLVGIPQAVPLVFGGQA